MDFSALCDSVPLVGKQKRKWLEGYPRTKALFALTFDGSCLVVGMGVSASPLRVIAEQG